MSQSPHLTLQEMEDFRQRKLEPEALLRVTEHLETCEECRLGVSGDDAKTRLRWALGQGWTGTPPGGSHVTHLTYGDLEKLANGAPADDQATLDEHLAECAMCAAELRDLRAFRSGLGAGEKPRPVRWFVPVGMLVAAALMVVSVIRSPEAAQPPANEGAPAVSANALRDGTLRLENDGAGGVRWLTGASDVEMKAAATALNAGRFAQGAEVAGLTRKTETLLGGGTPPGPALRPQSPLVEVVLSERPVFRWSQMPGAKAYRVDVYSADFEKVASSVELRTPQWQPPMPLARGGTFTWTVTATVNGATVTAPASPAPEARFRVASAEEAADIDRLERRVPRSALLMAIRASQLGLLDEARQAADELLRENPGSALVKRLRESLSAAN